MLVGAPVLPNWRRLFPSTVNGNESGARPPSLVTASVSAVPPATPELIWTAPLLVAPPLAARARIVGVDVAPDVNVKLTAELGALPYSHARFVTFRLPGECG